MSEISAIRSSSVSAAPEGAKPKPSEPGFREAFNQATKLATAARQFEALMIGQILKSANGPEGWLNAGDDDETASTAIEMAEEYLGQAIANGGGLGIAKLVVNGINRPEAKPANSGTAAPEQTQAHKDLPR
jgi:Rod binding domain-containing protein